MIGESPSTGTSVQSLTANGCTWVSVERPTVSEIEYLTREYGLARSDLEEALDRGRVSGVWRRDSYIVVVAHIPVITTGQSRAGLSISPVTLFVGRSFLVSVHLGEIRSLLRLFRQLETDDQARETTFEPGLAGVVRAIVHRLLDTVAAARGRIERAVADEEEVTVRSGNPRGARQTIAEAMRLRSEARQIRRVTTPLPELIRALDGVETLGSLGIDGWEPAAGRADRLIGALDDDLSALDGILLASSAMATLEGAKDTRALATIAALTLPVIATAALLSMPGGNPLASQSGGYAMSLAVAGVVFLIALFVARRRGMF